MADQQSDKPQPEPITILKALNEYAAWLKSEHGSHGLDKVDGCPRCDKIAQVEALIDKIAPLYDSITPSSEPLGTGETPRTDARAQFVNFTDNLEEKAEIVDADFARQLERELTETHRDSNYRYQKYKEEFERAEHWYGQYIGMSALVDQQQARAQKAEAALSAQSATLRVSKEHYVKAIRFLDVGDCFKQLVTPYGSSAELVQHVAEKAHEIAAMDSTARQK